MPPGPRTTTINIADNAEHVKAQNRSGTGLLQLRHTVSMSIQPLRARTPKLILLREEKDRFDEMRRIQHETRAFKHWYELVMSLLAFGLLWCGGAVVFWQCEKETQGMTYFTALYFCYVSLLTIGYGDLAPKSSPGRPFFVFWSLIAVPTITILISSLGETVIHKFKNGVSGIADFTVLPKHGVWRDIVERQPWLLTWLQNRKARKDLHKREEEGLPIGPDPEIIMQTPTIDELAKEEPSNNDLAKRLPEAIRRIVNDIKTHPNVRYSYEEWVEFTRLIRFSAKSEEDRETDENEDGLIEWDWIGEDSPMMSEGGEAEFLLDRLCESMRRYIKQASSWEPGPANSNARKKPPSERRAGSEESIVRRRLSDTNSPSPNDREDVGPHGEKP